MSLGAYAVEKDYSHYVSIASKTSLAIVGLATKGPVGEAVAVTSTQDLYNKFGALKPDYYGLYAAQYFLSQSSSLYFVRAAGASLAAAKVGITGVNAEDMEILNALEIQMLDAGTHANGFKLTITADDDNYTFILKNLSGTVLESTTIALENLKVDHTTEYIKVITLNSTTASLVAGEYVFTGGDDGIGEGDNIITAGDYLNAAKAIKAEKININLLAIPGVSDPAVVVGGLQLAEERGDTLFILDPPKGLTRDGVIQWVEGEGAYEHAKFNCTYGALYFDWVTIYDSVNKQYVTVPPSVPVCASIAYSDRTAELWFAPAGLNRGIIRGVVSPVTSLDKADIKLLYDHGINSIYEDPQVGNVIWGQKTLTNSTTALNRINVRRLMNYLKKTICAACNYLTFDPNDRVTWNSFEMKVKPVLENVKNRRGLYDYKIVKGEAIVTNEDIDNYRMPAMVLIRPTKSAEEIPIHFVITSTGADFNEVLEANGVVG